MMLLCQNLVTQAELVAAVSNARRENYTDDVPLVAAAPWPIDGFTTPMAFTLGHEVCTAR
jgi:hypothetical protein